MRNILRIITGEGVEKGQPIQEVNNNGSLQLNGRGEVGKKW